MDDIEVRPALPDEWAAVGALRWHYLQELDGEADASRDSFAAQFATWAATHTSHQCFVAVSPGGALGMAWLAVIDRFPSARKFERASGDFQCAYVAPEQRNRGIGCQLIDAVQARAGVPLGSLPA